MLATFRKSLLAASLLVGFILPLSPAVFAQGAAEPVSVEEELNSVREQQSRLEREAAQYRASMDLLRANGASGIDSPALQSLAEELGRTRAALRELGEREQALSSELLESEPSASPASAEVARLTHLLQGYYAEAATAEASGAEGSAATSEVLAQTALDNNKVLLSGTEGIVAINLISERLATGESGQSSRQRDIVFSVEVRRDGQLLRKSSHSLRPVGQSQFVSKVALRGGDARINVRNDQWRVKLGDDGDYLLTLHIPASGAAELHVIPVDALRATRWTEAPDWLPPLGGTASRS